jgi:hypothetical protein
LEVVHTLTNSVAYMNVCQAGEMHPKDGIQLDSSSGLLLGPSPFQCLESLVAKEYLGLSDLNSKLGPVGGSATPATPRASEGRLGNYRAR